MSKKLDLEGQDFGRLTVLHEAVKDNHGRIQWNCICECGQLTVARAIALTTGGKKSCGCLKRETIAKGRKIRSKQQGKKTLLSTTYSTYKNCAKRKKLKFELTREQHDKLVQQNCFYCGGKPQFRQRKDFKGCCGGIDRINSNKGYTIENCVPCCKHCNTAKNSMTQKWFYDWIGRVYKHSIEGRK